MNVQVDIQKILFNNELLDDWETLGELDIKRESVLHLILPKNLSSFFNINVKTLTGRTIQLRVREVYTILDVKRIIQDK